MIFEALCRSFHHNVNSDGELPRPESVKHSGKIAFFPSKNHPLEVLFHGHTGKGFVKVDKSVSLRQFCTHDKPGRKPRSDGKVSQMKLPTVIFSCFFVFLCFFYVFFY